MPPKTNLKEIIMSNMPTHAFQLLLLLLEKYVKSGKTKVRFYSEDYIDFPSPDFSIKELAKRGYIIEEGNIADSIILTELAFSELDNIMKQKGQK